MPRGFRPDKKKVYEEALILFYAGNTWNSIFKTLNTTYGTLKNVGAFDEEKVKNGNRIRLHLHAIGCNPDEIKKYLIKYYKLKNPPAWNLYCAKIKNVRHRE